MPVVATPEAKAKPSRPLSHYISWSELLRRTFQIETLCPACKTPLRLIALIKTESTIRKILSAMGLPTEAPKLYPARPPPTIFRGDGGAGSTERPHTGAVWGRLPCALGTTTKQRKEPSYRAH